MFDKCLPYALALLLVGSTGCQIISSVPENEQSVRSLGTNGSEVSLITESAALPAKGRVEAEGRDPTDLRFPSWIIDRPFLPILFVESNSLPDGECKEQAHKFLRELRKGKIWAARMYDASTKYPDGILAGVNSHLGNFDECYNEDFKVMDTRYCIVDWKYQRKEFLVPGNALPLEVDPDDAFYQLLRDSEDPLVSRRQTISTAICIPAACTAEDLLLALNGSIEQLWADEAQTIELSVKPILCQAQREAPTISWSGIVFCCIILVFCTLVACITWYDIARIKERDELTPKEVLLLCFSASRNMRSIFKIDYSNIGLDSLHAIRLFYILYLILAHRILQYKLIPLANPEHMNQLGKSTIAGFLLNATILVDVFFCMSGILVTYLWLDSLERKIPFSITDIVVKRFLRFTPLYIVVIWFYVDLFPHIGSGVLWKNDVERLSDFCRINWWTNVLYISNNVRRHCPCMLQSWYLSADFQMHIIAMFVMLAFHKVPRAIGYVFLGSVTLVACLVPSVITYIGDLPVAAFPDDANILLDDDSYVTKYYTKVYMRMGPYFAGVIIGAILHDNRSPTWHFSKATTYVLLPLVCLIIPVGVQHLIVRYWPPFISAPPVERALYAGFHKTIYALGICSIPILMTFGSGLDTLKQMLRAAWLQPVNKATYGIFLVHNIFQMYSTGSVRAPTIFTVHDVIIQFFGDTIGSFVVAYFLLIFIDMPCRNLYAKLQLLRNADKKNQ